VARPTPSANAKLRPNYLKVPGGVPTPPSKSPPSAWPRTRPRTRASRRRPPVPTWAAPARPRAHHDIEGLIEVVHDSETGQLLGGCIVGPEAGEQIHMMAAACQSTRGLWFFKDMSYSHPSWCEELETAIDPYTSAFSNEEQDLFRPGIFAGKA